MNAKHYVSLEAAKKLKEKKYESNSGFFFHAVERNYKLVYGNPLKPDELVEELYYAPTLLEAMDWLESKGIVVELSYDDKGHMDNALWQYFIYIHDEDGLVEGMECSWMEGNYFKTRLEAEDAAIIKALELL